MQAKYNNLYVIVIGTSHKYRDACCWYVGKVPNSELPKLLQLSDFYLFTSLCHEGFGLSLLEALKCGNICIASRLGGIPEVLRFGQLGILIDKPHIPSEWVIGFDQAVKKMDRFKSLDFQEGIKSYGNFTEWMTKFMYEITNS